MSRRAFDAEIALDLAVNLIPVVIIAFFVVLFAVFNPWGIAPLQSSIQFAILLSMIAGVGIATYYAARVIETDERTHHDSTMLDHGER